MGTGMGLTPDAGASHRPGGAKGFRESRVRSALSSADALVTAIARVESSPLRPLDKCVLTTSVFTHAHIPL